MSEKYNFFWRTMELCDWDKEGNDDQVLSPVIVHLAAQDDRAIFDFDDLMTELLYQLDTKKLADQCEKADPLMCDDTFLYSPRKRHGRSSTGSRLRNILIVLR